jgi:hypothetical protein
MALPKKVKNSLPLIPEKVGRERRQEMLDDITDWWDYCSHYDIKFCSRIKNYKLETITQDTVHRRAFIDNVLTNPYFALHYFKKSDRATEFYKALEFVCNNWEWAYTQFAPVSYQNWLSMDLASA